MTNNSEEKIIVSRKPKISHKQLTQQQNSDDIKKNSTHTINPVSNRKSANSWLAQSFRKAFGKIENKRNKNGNLNKSHCDLNSPNCNSSSAGRVVSTLSINNQEDHKLIHNHMLTSLSDEESENNELNVKDFSRNGKEKFQSKEGLNDSDSDYEIYKDKKLYFKQQHKNSSLVQTKRSYRSESELAKSSKATTTHNESNKIVEETNQNDSVETKNSIKVSSGRNRGASSTSMGSKLCKTHKSVSSLLTVTNNSNESKQYSKLQEINENYMNQSQFSLAKNPASKW